jgi:hypothetical protein
MTRQQVVSKLRELSGNRYFLATELDSPEGFHVHSDDLDRMNQRKLKALLAEVKFDVTDKGLWFQV